ncbi:MAG: YfcC family protein, partial [Candidatus Kapabacteria bacterium]|nr:YfcC family protein [Candidatus Kapabacteria bacterium]
MKKINIPHTFTIVFFIIIACAVMTWIIPGGEFERQTVQAGATTKSVVVSNSYHAVAQQPQTWQVFTSFFRGFERSANIIVFILM